MKRTAPTPGSLTLRVGRFQSPRFETLSSRTLPPLPRPRLAAVQLFSIRLDSHASACAQTASRVQRGLPHRLGTHLLPKGEGPEDGEVVITVVTFQGDQQQATQKDSCPSLLRMPIGFVRPTPGAFHRVVLFSSRRILRPGQRFPRPRTRAVPRGRPFGQ